MKMKKKKGLGSYPKYGLNMGLSDIEIDLNEMSKVFRQAKEKLKESYKHSINRLEGLIKKEFLVIPTGEDFINWYEENKLYKNWKGNGFVKINDEDIFKATKEYLNECKKKISLIKQSEIKPSEKNQSIILEVAEYNINDLVNYFSEEVFQPKTQKKDIKKVFSFPLQKPKSSLHVKINNKQFVYVLIKMVEENILVSSNLFGIMGELNCFKSKRGTILKRENLDQAKKQLNDTPLASETEDELNILIKNIKKQ